MALTDEPYMLALYGSRARGDDDVLSDIDMLYVGDGGNNIPINEADPRVCVSHYSWSEFEAMHQYGSLFLLHLKMQSRPVRFNLNGFAAYRQLMDTLPPYKRIAKDIESFRLALTDVRTALDSGDTAVEFELGSIATTVRHSSILGCYLLGKPEFGRYAAVETFCKATGLPSRIASEFVHLYQFRMMIARQGEAPQSNSLGAYVENWLGWSTDVVEGVAACYGRSRL
jgi:hypothetical protein